MPHINNHPLELYYAPTPNGWKLTIFMEECNLPFRLVPVNLTAGDQHKEAFLQISPNNRMPAILDKSVSPAVAVFESGAIMVLVPTHLDASYMIYLSLLTVLEQHTHSMLATHCRCRWSSFTLCLAPK